MSFELPEEYLNRCELINKDDLQKSFEDRDIEIADLKEEVNKIAFARGELETELNREKALNKVYEDNNRQLREKIEKMKKYIKACWVEENLNDYSSYITNSSDEFRDLVKELNEEIRNGR